MHFVYVYLEIALSGMAAYGGHEPPCGGLLKALRAFSILSFVGIRQTLGNAMN